MTDPNSREEIEPGRGREAGGRSPAVIARNLLLFLPRIIRLLGRLASDPQVSRLDKVLLLGAAAYLASPFDLIPDFIPGLGAIDDLYLAALVLLRFINRAGPERVRYYWDGPEDIVGILESATRIAKTLLPTKVRRLVELAAQSRDPDASLKRGGPPPSSDGSAET